MYYAALHGRVDILKTLLRYGADGTQPDVAGFTPLQRATNPINLDTGLRSRSAAHRECRDMLKTYIAAVTLQRVWRGNKGRKEWEAEAARVLEEATWEERHKMAAASLMQSTIRSLQTRIALSIQTAVAMEPIC